MKRILICIVCLLSCIPFHAQDDPVVMTVNGYDVRKSEFEYFFKKNSTETTVTEKTVKEYADLYLNFKLKVQAAIDEGMDKSESFLNEYKMYRDMQAEDYLVDKDFLEEVVRDTYEQSINEIGPDGLVHLLVISSTPEEDTPESVGKSLELLESVYEMLQSGQSFQALAKKYSGDKRAESGGVFGWVSRGQLPEDVADVVFSLEDGQYSKPFVSEGVAFIVMVDGHRQLGSFEENHDDIYNWALKSNAYTEAKRRKANDYATRLGWDVRDSAAVVYLDSLLEEVEPDFGNISREYHDGLLLFDISNKEIWERASSNPDEIEAYFRSNIKKYKFSEPCFKGMVFFCVDEDAFCQIEQALKDVDLSEWVDTILKFNKGNVRVRVMRGPTESGIFHKGQNAYVDKIVFGEGEFEPMENYPYVNVVGRILKQPEVMSDVAGQVTEDYQKNLEKEWVKKLRTKYKYKIYKKELKKVCLDK